MCGICGIINYGGNSGVERETLVKMCRVIEHRGPDDEGVHLAWKDAQGKYRLGFGHRRLSIIDLSPLGHQPMSNEDNSIWITYNGEIYNFAEIKQELIGKGHKFKSHTDTEVIIHLYEEEGKDCVKKLRGMFAFAIWDEKKRILFAARDRLGVKPFYYYSDKDNFIFASEIKSILRSGLVTPEVNTGVLEMHLTLGYTPAPNTMFKNINKLLPGYSLTISEGRLQVEEYWDICGIVKDEELREEEYIEQFRTMLNDCIRMRLVSDVPLGVFLSGGIDSSTVVGLMSAMTKERVKTFCVGYKERESSEFEYARIVAKKFNTDHHEYILEPTDFYDFIPKLIWYFDEPVVESAAIPLYFISKLAREHVTVLLSGEGADELLAGYSIYSYMQSIDKYRALPELLRKSIGDWIIKGLIRSKKKRDKYGEWINLPLEKRYLTVPAELNRGFKERLFNKEFLNKGKVEASDIIGKYYNQVKDQDGLSKMLYVDTKTWLPDDLLIKADKMSMATSVELRVPFLDHKLVEFAASIPSKYKLRDGTGKYLLKKAVTGLLPDRIINRKKKGFPVPINAWFKGNFSEKAKEVLLDSKSLRRGYFNKEFLQNIIHDHASGIDDHSKLLFSLVLLEFWHRSFIEGATWKKN